MITPNARAASPMASGTPEPTVRATVYAVSCLPADHRSARHFTVRVEERSPGLYSVSDGFSVLDKDGEWAFEPLPSEREAEWKARHRFDLETALALAKRVAPLMTVNGVTLADVLAREAVSG
jgi:hypothetical protein